MKKKKEIVKELELQDYYKEIEEMKITAEAAAPSEHEEEITEIIKVKEK